ncbi:MAG: uroporphyrinogen decarboxylase family protein [Methanomassiliicoccales archaeon]|nr:uroporphyrinogen decarboxylase family protein [Methanomassiliicoccales archaeon]
MVGMTSRERVIKAVERKEPDRPPIDFGGVVAGIVMGAPHGYEALCRELGIEDPDTPVINTRLSCVQNVDERILRRFSVDTRHINIGGEPLQELPDGKYRDAWGLILKQSGLYKSIPDDLAPLRSATTEDDIENYKYWPDPKSPSYIKGKRKEAKRLHERTDLAVFSHPGYAGRIFHMYAGLRGFDRWLLDMRMEPEFYKAFANKITDVAIDVCEAFYGEVGDYTDVAVYYDDMGMQTGGFMSLEDFRQFVRPYTSRYVKAVKNMTGAKVFYHTCGSVYSYLNDIIEMGIDILNPIQPLAKNMDPETLKSEFGGRICFHGGIDEQKLLPFGSKKEVEESVARTVKILAPGGGWIVAPAHNIQPDTPPENIVAMYDTALETASRLR